ncbi:MAG: cohesin domain-containing protein [Eubacteriales bacterium]
MKKRILTILLVMALVISMFPLTAFAASASVSAPASTTVGSTFSVTVKFSASNIGVVQATFSYDKSVLKYVSGSGTSDGKIVLYASAEGKSSLSTTIKFKALKAGKTTVSVNTTEFIDWDYNSLGTVSASRSVTVQTAGTTTTTKDPEVSTTPTVNPLDTAIPVTVGEQTLYLWTTLTDDITLPAGFTKTDSTYQEQSIQAATGNNITLVYLTDGNGGNGSFYVLDNGSLYKYQTITVSKTYIIVEPDSSVTVPDGYTETTMDINETSVKAWQSEETPGFYLVYVMNSEGGKGFYTYDTIEGTLQRYTERTVTVEEEPEETTVSTPGFLETLKSNYTMMIVFVALSALILILIITCIVLLVKKRAAAGKHSLSSINIEESTKAAEEIGETKDAIQEPEELNSTEDRTNDDAEEPENLNDTEEESGEAVEEPKDLNNTEEEPKDKE